MRAGQRETGHAMVKRSRVPAFGGVASRAIRQRKRRTRRGVHRIIGLLPGCKVASRISAGCRGNLQIVIIVDVAGGTGKIRVTVGQKKAGKRVVKTGGVPANCCVAIRAVCHREHGSRTGMNRVVRLLPGGEVASGVAAIGGRNLQVVVVVDVARLAWHVGMAVRQREARGAVIKLGAQPGVKRMTSLASG
jgi:hypothetical protein